MLLVLQLLPFLLLVAGACKWGCFYLEDKRKLTSDRRAPFSIPLIRCSKQRQTIPEGCRGFAL